jgi:hypothetical protein
MRYHSKTLLLVVFGVGLIGCGKSPSPGDGPASSGSPAASTEAQASSQGTSTASSLDRVEDLASQDTSKPESAVAVFLEALRRGEDEIFTRMYTRAARTQLARLDSPIGPIASDTARFEVGEVEYYPEDRAGVACTWTDLDMHGNPHTLDLVWILRREPEGWRVGGLAAAMGPDEPPMMLDFEKLDETLQQIDEARQRSEPTSEVGNLQAQQPENPGDSVTR